MATTESKVGTWNRQRVGWIVLAVLAVGFVVVLVLSLRTPPQMGPDEAVFKTVDALYTAVRNQDEKQLAACEGRLNAYKEAGKLPKESAEYLDGVIAKARGGGWETAAKRLYEFMLAQRREGELEHHPKDPKPRGPAKPAKK